METLYIKATKNCFRVLDLELPSTIAFNLIILKETRIVAPEIELQYGSRLLNLAKIRIDNLVDFFLQLQC